MNKNLTPQEAALYFDQECIYNGKFNFKVGSAILYELQQNQQGFESDIKLLLRPLSDITEEEAKELINWRGNSSCDTLDLISIRKDGIHYEGWAGTSSEGLTNPWWRVVNYDSLKPKQFQYLLSKGFDLFNFIEQGKALDKTAIEIGADRSGATKADSSGREASPN